MVKNGDKRKSQDGKTEGNSNTYNNRSNTNKFFIILVAVSFVAPLANIIMHGFLHGSNNRYLHQLHADELWHKFTNKQKDSGVVEEEEENVIIDSSPEHKIGGLSCEKYGGPAPGKAIDEMVYWSDIPSDSSHKSPFYAKEQYLTFEPDHGGWNNIRMAMETVLVMAHAMGRTLVLPPEQRMYLLAKDSHKHKTEFSFNDFFHLDSIDKEFSGLEIITMEEFLTREAMSGKLSNTKTGKVEKPPNSRVDWNGENLTSLFTYLRSVAGVPEWNTDRCVVAFPATTHPENLIKLQRTMDEINAIEPHVKPADFNGKPTPVDAPFVDRLKENLADRTELCLYDEILQKSRLVHFKVDHKSHTRLLIHSYGFVLFEDWKYDLWSKRFVRDHVRYIDELQCAAARVVQAVRERARTDNPEGNPEGLFDALHVRRGDFQYKKTRISAEELYLKSKENLKANASLFIATDERDKSFFKPLTDNYHVYFLDDFKHLFKGLNSNYYGMLDQIICTKSQVFYGTWFSTFSAYINRMRGYYMQKLKIDGYKDGTMKSWYFVPEDRVYEMREYRAVRKPFYMREFPTSWRDIDKGIHDL